MNLFAYGTLIFDDVMMRVTGRTFQGRAAVLQGYARYGMMSGPYPGIVQKKGSAVEGKLYFHIDDDSLKRLDEFEGDQYDRIHVKVKDEKGRLQDALTYKVKDACAHQVSCEAWRPEQFKR